MNIQSSLRRLTDNPSLLLWKINTQLVPAINIHIRKVLPKKFQHKSERANIALIHAGRSGSTILADLLQQDRDILWRGELIKHLDADTRNWQHIIDSAMLQSGRNRIFGAEFKFFHMLNFSPSVAAFIGTLEEMGFDRFIVLERRNYLRKIVSSVIANKTGVWHTANNTPVEQQRIELDTENIFIDNHTTTLIDALAAYTQSFDDIKVELRHRSTLFLNYENDIQSSPLQAYQAICEFIDKPIDTVSIRYGRTNAQPLTTLLSNYEHVAEVLDNTPYAWMLHD